MYSVTTHSYSNIFNTKINKWVWGTFEYQHLYTIKYYTYISYTLVMNTSGKRAQHIYIYQLSQFTCNIPVCIQLAIAYKIKKALICSSILKYSSTHPPPPLNTHTYLQVAHPHLTSPCVSLEMMLPVPVRDERRQC